MLKPTMSGRHPWYLLRDEKPWSRYEIRAYLVCQRDEMLTAEAELKISTLEFHVLPGFRLGFQPGLLPCPMSCLDDEIKVAPPKVAVKGLFSVKHCPTEPG